MAGYNYSRFISDFGKRTLDNQHKIDALRESDKENGMQEDKLNEKHHEVTQVINSLFGLLIVPYEKYKFNRLSQATSMRERDLQQTPEYYEIARLIIRLESAGRLYNDYEDNHLVSSFIKHLRNSLAHSGDTGLQFTPITEKETIRKVMFHDKDDAHQFCVELTIREVRDLSELLAQMYKRLECIKEVDDLPAYKEKYKQYSKLMKSTNKSKWAKGFEDTITNAEHKYYKRNGNIYDGTLDS